MPANPPPKKGMAKALSVHLVRLIFLGFLVYVGLLLHRATKEGYFETHMENVRRAAADKFIERMRNMPNASVLPSGLIFSVQREGNGPRAPAADDACDIHYRAEYRFYKALHDTHEGAYPVHLAPSQFIPGVSEALQLMRPGAKWRLIVPYTLAYGMEGNETLNVPSLVNLRFELELVRCDGELHGRTAEEIDALLAPHLKTTAAAAPVSDRSADL